MRQDNSRFKILYGICFTSSILLEYCRSEIQKSETESRSMSGLQGLEMVPGLGYVDTASILLLSSIPVLVLIGLGAFLTPLFALVPAYYASANGISGAVPPPIITPTNGGGRSGKDVLSESFIEMINSIVNELQETED